MPERLGGLPLGDEVEERVYCRQATVARPDTDFAYFLKMLKERKHYVGVQIG